MENENKNRKDAAASDTKRIVNFCAFRNKTVGFDEAGIYWAENASKARHMSKVQAEDAGYYLDYKDIKIERAPEYDDLKPEGSNGLGEYFVKEQLAN